tara:strand:- start:82 stop:531 length:450 start_codon:yes stop_codon:yes gene_type:complete
MKRFLGIVFLSLFVNNFTYADLKGITEMKLLIEYLNPKAETCGVSEEKLETSVRYILSNSKIKIVGEAEFVPILYINANIGNNNGCYANTSIEVYKYMKDPNSNNWGHFVYYNSNEISSGGEDAKFGDPYINSFEQQLKKLVVEHSKDN